mgnify:CR=1
VTIQKNEKAPFAGTLLNPAASARILATTNTSVQECLIEAKHDLALQSPDYKLQLSNKEAALVACQLRYDRSAEIYK